MTFGGTSAAVAAGHSETAQAAAMILREGGNAFDAAIAGLWMACVVEPVFASPGGGGFLMGRRSERQQINLFDFFVQTPSRKRPLGDVEFEAVQADFGTATQEFHIGAGSSAVPGFVPGLFAIHEALGSIPMARLAEQAIETARTGVKISRFQADLLEIVKPIYLWTADTRQLFAPEGHLVRQGDNFKNPQLADAIDAITSEGLRIAIEGEIAQAMLLGTADGGCLRAEDLKYYEVFERAPEKVGLQGQTLHLNPPPSSGGTLIGDMLRQSSEHLANDHLADDLSPKIIAQIIAATDRRWRHADCDIRQFLKSPVSRPGGHASRGTTHISIVDHDNNAASVTVSNGEGNGRLVPGCGFMVSNMLGEEDLNQGGFYNWSEGQRLASMMSPTISLSPDGTVTAIGSGGSNRIRSAVFQVLNLLISKGLSVEEATFAPRVHVEHGHLDFEALFGEGDNVSLTEAFPDHRAWPERNMFFGGAHVVRKTAKGSIEAAGDPRRAGVAVTV